MLQPMGYVEMRPGKKPLARWNSGPGTPRQTRVFETVEAAEQHLKDVEGAAYVPPNMRRPGRPEAGRDEPLPKTLAEAEKCDCSDCKMKVRDHRRDLRAKKKKLLQTNPEKFVHGSANTYGLGCTCEPCVMVGRKKRADAVKTNNAAWAARQEMK